jgi:hypothetical protein
MTVTSDRVQVARERAEHDRVDRMTHACQLPGAETLGCVRGQADQAADGNIPRTAAERACTLLAVVWA